VDPIPSDSFEEALVHLSGVFRVARILKGGNGMSISDEDWDHIEIRLLNAVSLTERKALADNNPWINKRINLPVFAQRLHKIIQATELEMVPSMQSQLNIPGLRYRLTVLSVRINFLFSSYLEPEQGLEQDQHKSHRRPEIASMLIPLVRTFLELLLRYDPCLNEFVHSDSNSQFLIPEAKPDGVAFLISRIQSYCLASFIHHALLTDETDRSDAKIQGIGMLCVRCLTLAVSVLHIPWLTYHEFLFHFVLGKMLLPRARFPHGTCITKS
jgi:hypothetical protein